ncbi:hypothetical protein [Streptomyces europaeiscabiei]|uniref:hypothetical protein n=1 Tax=Streptomyces europaeiscabiei TaxID=146819 RepID=UPI0029A89B13|nr:hypothetical protein [Streptomyces europaeiscabiei]MDX2527923.1 hypothetical protein [Streptomyces europaeiscabiei]MDX2762758.1 hypothetical protein [Streptomyces europaeiscabiei]MDX3784178.1 hypothetical protein [Streptomyces europaeiscabiei]MDX3831571.1 hypothetical protein [Streptomyces europaeiscabiei]
MTGRGVVLIEPRSTEAAGAPELAAVRFIALLPDGWDYEPEFVGERFTVRLRWPTDQDQDPDQDQDQELGRALDRIFTDSSLRAWRWTDITHRT